jgi:hypothetical protein
MTLTLKYNKFNESMHLFQCYIILRVPFGNFPQRLQNVDLNLSLYSKLEYNENNLLEYDLALHTKGLKNVPTL